MVVEDEESITDMSRDLWTSIVAQVGEIVNGVRKADTGTITHKSTLHALEGNIVTQQRLGYVWDQLPHPEAFPWNLIKSLPIGFLPTPETSRLEHKMCNH
jgi:hypothetical protein